MTPPARGAHAPPPRATARPATRPPRTAARHRIGSVDLLRGLVMVIMLLDHTRDFFHAGALFRDPTDLATTTPALFLTRWITHFCAPVFVLLAGVSASLQLQQGRTKGELSRFLWTRGLMLVLLEVTVIRFGIFFNLDYSLGTPLQVIWVLGVSMIALAALIHLPLVDLGVGALTVIALHNVFDRVRIDSWDGAGSPMPGFVDQLGAVLHQPGLIAGGFFVVYPLIPWVAVMAAGFVLGSLWTLAPEARSRRLLQLGAGCLALFVALRALNLYGDPSPWAVQARGALFTALSFINVMKYPPSLQFLALTIGPALLLLGWMERPGSAGAAFPRTPPGRSLAMLGTVPLFFYVLQWYVPHLLAWAAHGAAGKPTEHMTLGPAAAPAVLADTGFSLPVVYLAWAVSLALIYPLCAWYAGVKARRRDGWLRYL